jgi:hypothetical protein
VDNVKGAFVSPGRTRPWGGKIMMKKKKDGFCEFSSAMAYATVIIQ